MPRSASRSRPSSRRSRRSMSLPEGETLASKSSSAVLLRASSQHNRFGQSMRSACHSLQMSSCHHICMLAQQGVSSSTAAKGQSRRCQEGVASISGSCSPKGAGAHQWIQQTGTQAGSSASCHPQLRRPCSSAYFPAASTTSPGAALAYRLASQPVGRKSVACAPSASQESCCMYAFQIMLRSFCSIRR